MKMICRKDKIIVWENNIAKEMTLGEAVKRYKINENTIINAIECGTEINGLVFDLSFTYSDFANTTEFDFNQEK